MARYKTKAAALIGIALLVVFPSMVFGSGVIWVVGGEDAKWESPGFDYQAWSDSMRFWAGDELVFKYDPSSYNVVVAASQDDYDQCNLVPNLGVYSSGQDALILTSPGNYYFMCQGLCESGMKFVARAKE
ncbi:hypothetical protein ACLB2K_066982 [Fragaria x ananassa]